MQTKLTTPNEILQKALQMENQAHDFYAGLAGQISVDFVRELLETLQNEESKHVHMIRDMISRLESGKRVL